MITLEKKRSVPEKFFTSENVSDDDAIRPIPHWLNSLSGGKCALRKRFVAGTKVYTKDGLKNIEEIKIGDKVLSKNEITGELEYKTVTKLFLHGVELLFKLRMTGGANLETTWNHPFMIKGRGWVQVKDLRIGDEAILHDGRLTQIQSIEQVHVAPTKVYNLEVEDFHTYFVGDDGVWVHNYMSKSELTASGLLENGNMLEFADHMDNEAGIFGRFGQRLWNGITLNGFNTDGEIIAGAIETGGISKEISMKEQMGIPLTASDKKIKEQLKVAAATKDKILADCKCKREDGAIDRSMMTFNQRVAYDNALKSELSAEYDHSQKLWNRWKDPMRTEVPLTPFSKRLLADQFPSLNLDSIRISNGGVSNAIWTTLSGGSPITPGCCTIYSGNSSPNSPGGINQFGTSTVSTLRGMPLIAHELTHPVQNSGLGLGFATRYLGADKLVSGISGRGNYDVTRFYPDTDLFIQNPAKIIGNESNFTYTNSNQETRYTTYDSWAELQKDMMKNRIKQLGLSNDRLQPQ